MTTLPIQEIKKFLARDEKIRSAIEADYGIEPTNDPEILSRRLVTALDQVAEDNPEESAKSNSDVFKAATLAIASSTTNWSTIQKKKISIELVLCQYDLDAVKKVPDEEIHDELIHLLPGQNQKNNAAAIIEWSRLLTADGNFYKDVICTTYHEITQRPAWSAIEKSKNYPMAVLCLAGIFGNPVNRWKKLKKPKFPGMQVPIACEFLRNLGWSGFKPDRHVIRAIALWENSLKEKHEDNVEKAFWHIVDIIDTRSKTIVCPIKSAIYAIYATPKGIDYSEADNLLWAFVSNVVNLREKDIVNMWLKNQLEMNIKSFEAYDKITKIGLWPNSLICEE